MELLQYAFFRNALTGSILIAIACGITGAYIVARRLVFISGGITHASFGGLGLGFYLGANPILTALLFSILAALGVERISRNSQVREDSAIAGIWSLGMALGVIFIFLTPGYAPNLSAYLFGNILTISSTDLIAMAALAATTAIAFALFHKEITAIAFDKEFALTQRLPVRLAQYVMMTFIATTIVLSIRLAGIMLLMSMLTMPQMTVNLFTSSLVKIASLSIAIGFLACITGLILSYYLDIPSGAFIILILVTIFLIAKAISSSSRRQGRSKIKPGA
jgi:zinc transport system permease protein